MKEILKEILKENNAVISEKDNKISFSLLGVFHGKIFFHEDNVFDFMVSYPSTITKSNSRNLVIKGNRKPKDLLNQLSNTVNGILLSNSVVNGDKEAPLIEKLSFDTYMRYEVCYIFSKMLNTHVRMNLNYLHHQTA